MVRAEPAAAPSRDAVARVVEGALRATVTGVEPFDAGLNAVYRVDRPADQPVVLKAATVSTDEEVTVEARLLARFDAETTVPLPSVRAIVEQSDGLGVAGYVMDYCAGENVRRMHAFSPADRERLVAESGRHLAALHAVRPVTGFGQLGTTDGEVSLRRRHDRWRDWFDELADDALAGLAGVGFTTDADPRFADLRSVVHDPLHDAPTDEWTTRPSVLLTDYRPANLVVAPGEEPMIRAVLDVGNGPVGDGVLDLALAEHALVDLPHGGTERAERLRTTLRDAYSARTTTFDPDGTRYAAYKLYAWIRRLGAFDYWVEAARESDPDAVARRARTAVRELGAAVP